MGKAGKTDCPGNGAMPVCLPDEAAEFFNAFYSRRKADMQAVVERGIPVSYSLCRAALKGESASNCKIRFFMAHMLFGGYLVAVEKGAALSAISTCVTDQPSCLYACRWCRGLRACALNASGHLSPSHRNGAEALRPPFFCCHALPGIAL